MRLLSVCTIICLGVTLILAPTWAETWNSASPDTVDPSVSEAENHSLVKVGILVMKSGFVSDIGTEY